MPDDLSIIIDGESIPVKIRRNALAKRLTLRVDQSTGDVRVTLPVSARLSQAESFLQDNLIWISNQRYKLGGLAPLGHDDTLLYRGVPHILQFLDTPPRRVIAEDGQLYIGGPADQAANRLFTWLKAQTRKQVEASSALHAEKLGVSFSRIGIGDMRSRWGSCSARGTLKFNWRLILAPDAVLDYVAAHEVAHLLEMNHSDRFWAHVETCVPGYAVHRRWLKKYGGDLFNVRLKAPV